MSAPPSLTELQELAERALGHLEGDGQVLVLWERRDEALRFTVTYTAIRGGRGGEATTDVLDDEHLARAARGAGLRSEQSRAWPAPPLPQPAKGRLHEGFDATLLAPAPRQVEEVDGVRLERSSGAARIAIASTTGLRAAEQRTWQVLTAGAGGEGRQIRLTRAAVGPVAAGPVIAEAQALASDDAPEAAEAGEAQIVLGYNAVAGLLDRFRAAFGVAQALGEGPLAGRFGSRVAAAAVNLSDSARYPGTLPRSYDAEGHPRQPVPLIQDGVAHAAVHDTASAIVAGGGARSTGHATRAGAMAPYPEHLVLVGGGADDVEALLAPVERGLYIPALGRDDDGRTVMLGARRIVDGAFGAPLLDAVVDVDPLAVLSRVQALSGVQRVVPLTGHCPGGPGAAVVPALRSRGGLHVLPA